MGQKVRRGSSASFAGLSASLSDLPAGDGGWDMGKSCRREVKRGRSEQSSGDRDRDGGETATGRMIWS